MIGRRKATPTELPERLDAFRTALVLAEGKLEPDAIAAGSQLESKAAGRLRHGTTHTLVALLGATGSGKSSVANALVGSNVATTGVRRPTTSSTLACVWGDDDANDLLDWLDVTNRHLVSTNHHDLDGLVVLDVPDHDSVAVGHRLEMERIAEHADLLLWVTDPEKYADKAMHGYLRRLGHHGAVTVMVLNKSDRLAAGDVAVMTQDLERLLVEDGIAAPRVIALSATTGERVDELINTLIAAVEEQRMMIERLSADLAVAAGELSTAAGSQASGNLPDRVAQKLTADLVDASGLAVVSEAVAAGHRRDAAARTGWPFTRWLRKLRPHPLRKLHLGTDAQGRSSLPSPSGAQMARAQAAVRDAADVVATDLPSPWPTLVREAGLPSDAALHDGLDTAIGDAVRNHRARTPRWWAVVGTIQVLLALTAVAGALWLLGLALFGYLQLPALPTPTYRGIPYPTGMLILGGLAGWLLAMLSRRLAGIGARRRAAQTRKDAAVEVEAVAEQLVLTPIRTLLSERDELVRHLDTAAGAD